MSRYTKEQLDSLLKKAADFLAMHSDPELRAASGWLHGYVDRTRDRREAQRAGCTLAYYRKHLKPAVADYRDL